jgi:hypothetical protein
MFGIGKKKSDKDNPDTIGTTIDIVIKRQMADNLFITIAQFSAQQIKDRNFNLVLTSEQQKSFKEDFNFDEFQIIETLKARLGFGNMEQRKNKITEAINNQNKRLSLIQDGYYFYDEVNLKKYRDAKTKEKKDDVQKEKVNKIDEQARLTFLHILNKKIDYEGNGSYEEINMRGRRQITFLSRDGVLIPFFISSTKVTAYADASSKRKMFYEYSDRNESWWAKQQADGMQGFFWNILKILLILMIAGNSIWAVRNHEHGESIIKDRESLNRFLDESYLKEFVLQNRGDAVSCAYYYTELMKEDGQALISIRNKLANMSIDAIEKNIKRQDIEDVSAITKGLG